MPCKSRAALLNAPLNSILNGTLNRLRLNDCGALVSGDALITRQIKTKQKLSVGRSQQAASLLKSKASHKDFTCEVSAITVLD